MYKILGLVYAYLCAYLYICAYNCTFVRILVHLYVYLYICTHTCEHTCICTHTCVHICTFARALVRTLVHLYVYLYSCILVFLYTCILLYVYTCIPVFLFVSYLAIKLTFFCDDECKKIELTHATKHWKPIFLFHCVSNRISAIQLYNIKLKKKNQNTNFSDGLLIHCKYASSIAM